MLNEMELLIHVITSAVVLTKPTLKLGHGWASTSHIKSLMQLIMYVLISLNPFYESIDNLPYGKNMTV